MAVNIELGHASIQQEVQPPVAILGNRNAFLENLQLEIEERNNQIASALSLVHNKPKDGRTRVQQEEDRLSGTSREKWERTKSPMAVGEIVSIPAETPVGLGGSNEASYITKKPLQGILTETSRGYGGMGYLESSRQIIEPLFKVVVVTEGYRSDAVTLLVPNDLLTQALQV